MNTIQIYRDLVCKYRGANNRLDRPYNWIANQRCKELALYVVKMNQTPDSCVYCFFSEYKTDVCDYSKKYPRSKPEEHKRNCTIDKFLKFLLEEI